MKKGYTEKVEEMVEKVMEGMVEYIEMDHDEEMMAVAKEFDVPYEQFVDDFVLALTKKAELTKGFKAFMRNENAKKDAGK